MGAAYARTVMGLRQPRVRLLNIGSEEGKGTDELKEAAATLRDAGHVSMKFEGFIEGDRLARGEVDVIVTDGFSGNITLKTIEGDGAVRHRSAAPRLLLLVPLEGGLPDLAPRDRAAAPPSRSEPA